MRKKKKKVKGDEYLKMKAEKKSPLRRKVEKAGLVTIVTATSALSAVVLGYTATKFLGVKGKNDKYPKKADKGGIIKKADKTDITNKADINDVKSNDK